MSDERRRVLLAEDDLDLIKVATRRMELQGFDVFVARDGEEAITKAQKEQFDVIVLDLKLPGRNGFEVCKLLRQDQRFRKTPIIFYSAKLEEMDEKRLRHWGADAFVCKAEGSAALIAVVQDLLFRFKK